MLHYSKLPRISYTFHFKFCLISLLFSFFFLHTLYSSNYFIHTLSLSISICPSISLSIPLSHFPLSLH